MMKKRRGTVWGFLIVASLLVTFLVGCQNKYEIGDTGPAGGLIFYIDEADEYSWTYLEVAPESTEWEAVDWGDNGTEIGGDAALTGIGDGQAATEAIVQHLAENTTETDRAAQLCDALSHNGFDDWFLPSSDELYALWENLVDDGPRPVSSNKGVGGLAYDSYWSSSETGSYLAWHQNLFGNGLQGDIGKARSRRVRAVRAF